MRDTKGATGLSGLGHWVAVKRGHIGIGRARRVEQDGGDRTTDGGPLHDANEKAQHRQERIRGIAKDRDENRERDGHRHRTSKARCRTHEDTQKEARQDHEWRDGQAEGEFWTCEDGGDAHQDIIKNSHQTSPFGGSSRSSNGRS